MHFKYDPNENDGQTTNNDQFHAYLLTVHFELHYAATFNTSQVSSTFTKSDISQSFDVTPAAIAGVILGFDGCARNCSA
jgi:hypothetical protein